MIVNLPDTFPLFLYEVKYSEEKGCRIDFSELRKVKIRFRDTYIDISAVNYSKKISYYSIIGLKMKHSFVLPVPYKISFLLSYRDGTKIKTILFTGAQVFVNGVFSYLKIKILPGHLVSGDITLSRGRGIVSDIKHLKRLALYILGMTEDKFRRARGQKKPVDRDR